MGDDVSNGSRSVVAFAFPIVLFVAIVTAAVGYGELRGKVTANSGELTRMDREWKDERSDVKKWREDVTRALARIEQQIKNGG